MRDTSISVRARGLSRLWFWLSVILAIPSLILLALPAEISALVQVDGTTSWFLNRQFDLSTGDPAKFYDYSLRPFLWCFLACSSFYYLLHRLVLKYAP